MVPLDWAMTSSYRMSLSITINSNCNLQRFGRNVECKVAVCSHHPRAPNRILAFIDTFRKILRELYVVDNNALT